MIALPLATLLLWDVAWALYLVNYSETSMYARETLQSMEGLITPLLVPVSFLLVFRLGRAAVRYWDARSAMGKMVEVCRTTASTALVGIYAGRGPRRSGSTANATTTATATIEQQQLAKDIVRWIAVFPVAVKNFLRSTEGLECKRHREIESILDINDRDEFLECKGEHVYAPILVLNRLRQLAYEASTMTQQPSDAMGALLFRQLSEQIDILTGTWGAMERINGTPLPFVYVVHLRTFLLLYLLLWHMEGIASEGWIAMLPLMLASWGLLGIEAASVECERPFHWGSNHLALGKACIVVAKNLVQTMDNTGWTQIIKMQAKAPLAPSEADSQEGVETGLDQVRMLGALHRDGSV